VVHGEVKGVVIWYDFVTDYWGTCEVGGHGRPADVVQNMKGAEVSATYGEVTMIEGVMVPNDEAET